MEGLSDNTLVTLAGFAGGSVLGLSARVSRFCTLGAIEDALYGGSRDRILMWPMAIGVAVAATTLLTVLGLATVDNSVYLRFEFSLLASVVGGLMFGVGMALAGNCGFGALARLGGGDIRSLLIVLVIGISAYVAAIGPLAELRLLLFPRSEAFSAMDTTIPGLAARHFGAVPWSVSLLVAVLMVAYALGDRHFRENGTALFWSTMVGLAVAGAWWSTTHIAETGFAVVAVEAHTFTMPLGEILLQAMGMSDGLGGFSVGSVAGVLFGAFLGARARRQFRWEACDDPGELKRQLFGGVLMGIGGVVALGCSIGQGLSAFSVLALSAPVTLASIAAGAVVGLKYLIEGHRPLGALTAPLAALGGWFKNRSG